MLEQFILGIVQGIAEWLPVSSEGLIVLVKTNFLQSTSSFEVIIKEALFLHLGTFMAAFIYFFKDVVHLSKSIFSYNSQPKETQNLISFLSISTLISGVLGFTLIKSISHFAALLEAKGKFITLIIGALLLGTAYLELRAKKGGYRTLKDLNLRDSVILGISQGCAALPGLSRSGITVSVLLLRKIDKAYALKLSFLMSLPIVLAGNIILNFNQLSITPESLIGLTSSFVFGLATIHLLLKLAEKINFGYFMIFFGLLTLSSVLI